MSRLGQLWDGFKLALIILFILSIPLTVIALGGMAFGLFPEETTYSYEVKAQQVFDGERVEDSDVTEMENLSADEQKLLYDAFKKTDHFMGSEQVTLSYQDERLDTFNDWRTVESNGVLLLVAVNEEPEQSPDHDAYHWYHWMLLFAMIYCVIGWFYIIMLGPV